ncbi:citrate lyase holo-[acyl-carrier protein] synthase [Komagataeibacter sp. SM21]|uniref:citrate lyase holo-[acyl-carrier protein] synthase n=1 Tax=Komagataeibacter sp. SM21 TaxID=3242899 RepID=UPI0035290170
MTRDGSDALADGSVPLSALLAAREARAYRQHLLLEDCECSLISLTIVSPGPVKSSLFIDNVFHVGVTALHAACDGAGLRIDMQHLSHSAAGPEALCVVRGVESEALKQITVNLEDTHPLGRLWDLDVIAPGMNVVSREQFGLPARRCLACQGNAHFCARNRQHPLPVLEASMKRILSLYEEEVSV